MSNVAERCYWASKMRWIGLAAAALIGLGAACPPVPAPPIPNPPISLDVHVTARGQDGAPVSARGTLATDDAAATVLIGAPFNDTGVPRLHFGPLPASVLYTHGAWLTLDASGFDRYRERVELAPDLDVQLVPDVPPIPRLVRRGQFLAMESGERFTVIGASGFTLYQQYLDSKPIEPVLAQLHTLGFNTVRVFGMYNNSHPLGLGRFIPADYGSRYWEGLAGFYRLLAKHKLYGEFVVFADTEPVMGADVAAQVAHFNRVVMRLQFISNALLEAVNEADQPINRTVSLGVLPRPVGVTSSHGSNGSQLEPVMPYWDYVTFHTNDAFEEARKVGHNAWELWQGPSVTNETSRAPDKGYYGRGKGLSFAEDAAAGAALLAAGSTYHSRPGKYGQLLDGAILEYARAWAAGALKVPLDCQAGAYRHRDDLETPGILRVYERVTGDPRCIVSIR